MDKFQTFLRSLESPSNVPLIEAISQGYSILFESIPRDYNIATGKKSLAYKNGELTVIDAESGEFLFKEKVKLQDLGKKIGKKGEAAILSDKANMGHMKQIVVDYSKPIIKPKPKIKNTVEEYTQMHGDMVRATQKEGPYSKKVLKMKETIENMKNNNAKLNLVILGGTDIKSNKPTHIIKILGQNYEYPGTSQKNLPNTP